MPRKARPRVRARSIYRPARWLARRAGPVRSGARRADVLSGLCAMMEWRWFKVEIGFVREKESGNSH